MKPLISSGSLVPGIDATDFRLPPGSALRIERPAEPLRRYLPSYFVMASDEGVAAAPESMLPGWAMIWILLNPAAVNVEIRNRRYAGLASSVLYGVTSRAMAFNAMGGIAVGIDVSPLGWARLLGHQSAEALRDRIVPLVEVLPAEFVEELYLGLLASDRALEVKPVLDRLFLPVMATPHSDEERILTVLRLLEDGRFTDFASAAAAQGISPRSTARLTRSFFGFPPKTLMMRTRFLRALVPLLDQETRSSNDAVPNGYYDRSHFNRDAQRYLGMSPQRYINTPSPYAAAARRARRAVIGSPIPALDRIAEDALGERQPKRASIERVLGSGPPTRAA